MARTASLTLAGPPTPLVPVTAPIAGPVAAPLAVLFAVMTAAPLAAQDPEGPPTAADTAAASIHVMEGGLAEVTGVRIPVSPDTFALTDIHRTPRLALGIVVGYQSPLFPQSDLTLYVFPVPGTVEEHFYSALAELRASFEDRGDDSLELGEREEIAIEGTDAAVYEGLATRGMFGESGNRRVTELWVFRKGTQLLKYRVSYPATLRSTMEPHFQALLSETLGETDVADAPTDTAGTIMEVGPSSVVLDGVRYPTRADTFDLFDLERSPNPQVGRRAVYRSPIEGAPTLNVVTSPENGSLEEAFQGILSPVLASAERSGLTPTVEQGVMYEQELPDGASIQAMRGSIGADTPNGRVDIGFKVAEIGPWWIALHAQHPPGEPGAERMDPEPIFSTVLASIRDGLDEDTGPPGPGRD